MGTLRRMPSSRSSSPPAPALFSHPVVVGLQAASQAWRVMGTVQRLQMQSLDRMMLRAREMATGHGQCLSSPADCMDLPLAGTRWALQEWDQSWQDLITAALSLRGDLLMDSGLNRYLPQPWLDAGMAPLLDAWGDMADVQMRAWQDMMALCRHRERPGPPATEPQAPR